MHSTTSTFSTSLLGRQVLASRGNQEIQAEVVAAWLEPHPENDPETIRIGCQQEAWEMIVAVKTSPAGTFFSLPLNECRVRTNS